MSIEGEIHNSSITVLANGAVSSELVISFLAGIILAVVGSVLSRRKTVHDQRIEAKLTRRREMQSNLFTTLVKIIRTLHQFERIPKNDFEPINYKIYSELEPEKTAIEFQLHKEREKSRYQRYVEIHSGIVKLVDEIRYLNISGGIYLSGDWRHYWRSVINRIDSYEDDLILSSQEDQEISDLEIEWRSILYGAALRHELEAMLIPLEESIYRDNSKGCGPPGATGGSSTSAV